MWGVENLQLYVDCILFLLGSTGLKKFHVYIDMYEYMRISLAVFFSFAL